MADHDGVGVDGLQGLGRVLQGFALGHGGALGREVDDVGGEPLLRGLEGDAGAGGVLEEQVDHGAPAQGGQLLDLAGADLPHPVRGVQQGDGLLAAVKGRSNQQVAFLDSAGRSYSTAAHTLRGGDGGGSGQGPSLRDSDS